MTYDPDERFSLYGIDPEEGLEHLLNVRVDPADLEPEEQVEDEPKA